MHKSEDDFDKLLNSLKNFQSNEDREHNQEDSSLDPESVRIRRNQIERVFIKLIAIGLSLGLIFGIGVYIAFEKLGLSKKPYEIEQERQQQQSPAEQINYQIPHLPLIEGDKL